MYGPKTSQLQWRWVALKKAPLHGREDESRVVKPDTIISGKTDMCWTQASHSARKCGIS